MIRQDCWMCVYLQILCYYHWCDFDASLIEEPGGGE